MPLVRKQTVKPGTVAMHAGTVPPAGWLERNGAAVSRTLYAALFAAIGTTWGAGDGVNTFNLPDARDDFDRGASATRPVGSKATDSTRSHTHNVGFYDQDNAYPAIVDNGVIAFGPGSSTRATTASGGAETAPRHGCYLPIIKY